MQPQNRTYSSYLLCFLIIISCNNKKVDNNNLYDKMSSLEGLDIDQDVYLEKAWYFKNPKAVRRWINHNLRFESNPFNFYNNLEIFGNTTSMTYGIESCQIKELISHLI